MVKPSLLSDEEIVARARSVFVDLGYGARTVQIAAAVNLSWGAIARRLGDKRALFTRAMAGPVCSPDELGHMQAGSQSLAGLLEQLRACLWQRWPLRLQYGLATPAAARETGPDPVLEGLTAALQAQARRGSLRSDIGARALAQLVLALLVGDVAQRFVAREQTLPSDPAFIAGVVRLLSAT